ncbi:MAG: vanadium-dependent haloperoxidase [Deltaproteobacteria bacterium]|nr:MAG: vanadium-dependent haloperoxidase [Deltaproteobacteria bacterium]
MRIVDLNKLALDLVAMDFSNGHAPSNGGPTKTSRALAIIHLAARDAYARVTSAYAPKLQGLAAPHAGIGPGDADGQAAAVGAGIRAVTVLYPDFGAFIAAQSPALTAGLNPAAVMYGGEVANAWLASRHDDGSSQPQLDSLFSAEPGHHRPDPVSNRPSLGRAWGRVTPFVISSVTADAPLGPPPALTTKAYADAYDDVFVNGRNNIAERTPEFRDHAAIGIFWGYDGSSRLGTPPRLYNQIVVSTTEFAALAAKDQLNVLAAINAAMADAGIAAWHWKYVYDLWRPVTAIREANQGFGPTGKGDGNTHRKQHGDPFWLPLGAPASNPFPGPMAGAPGENFTPNFPAYPSGHATFGTACFETFAGLLKKRPSDIVTTFVSDEFNGTTVDNDGVIRPRWEQKFSLEQGIEMNKISRIYLGVHWSFDASGGGEVGKAIAGKAIAGFR